jgi:hypothetical protein
VSHDACERAAFDGPDKGGNGQRTRYADQPSTRTGNTHDVVIGNMIRTTECEPQNEKFLILEQQNTRGNSPKVKVCTCDLARTLRSPLNRSNRSILTVTRWANGQERQGGAGAIQDGPRPAPARNAHPHDLHVNRSELVASSIREAEMLLLVNFRYIAGLGGGPGRRRDREH